MHPPLVKTGHLVERSLAGHLQGPGVAGSGGSGESVSRPHCILCHAQSLTLCGEGEGPVDGSSHLPEQCNLPHSPPR